VRIAPVVVLGASVAADATPSKKEVLQRAAKYIDAFFSNIQWDEVNRRFERAQKAAAALRA